MLDEEIYEKEISMCQELSKSSDCKWGKCADCGVVPLLIKLKTGKVLEDTGEIENMKKDLGIL